MSGDDIGNSFEQNEVVFETPKENFWNRVHSLFELEQFNLLKESVYEVMGHQNGPIEMRHFFKYEENKFPLFNASLLVDFYKKLLCTVDEQKYMQHINLTSTTLYLLNIRKTLSVSALVNVEMTGFNICTLCK